MKKDGLRQCQDGTWKLSLTVHPDDMPTALMTAPMGTCYAVAMVEIGDDGQPVQQNAKGRPSPSAVLPEEKASGEEYPAPPADKPKGGRRAREAGIACLDPQFQAWAHNCGWRLEYAPIEAWVRDICGKIVSRAELDHNEKAGKKWDALYAQFLEETPGRMAERR